jgi:hypothetical protein
LYEGPGSDWEGAGTALDQMAYALAKARGLDTTQTCPECQTVVDQVATVGRYTYTSCDACEATYEARHQREHHDQKLAEFEHAIWLSMLPPEERAAYLEEVRRTVTLSLRGLMMRDVQ